MGGEIPWSSKFGNLELNKSKPVSLEGFGSSESFYCVTCKSPREKWHVVFHVPSASFRQEVSAPEPTPGDADFEALLLSLCFRWILPSYSCRLAMEEGHRGGLELDVRCLCCRGASSAGTSSQASRLTPSFPSSVSSGRGSDHCSRFRNRKTNSQRASFTCANLTTRTWWSQDVNSVQGPLFFFPRMFGHVCMWFVCCVCICGLYVVCVCVVCMLCVCVVHMPCVCGLYAMYVCMCVVCRPCVCDCVCVCVWFVCPVCVHVQDRLVMENSMYSWPWVLCGWKDVWKRRDMKSSLWVGADPEDPVDSTEEVGFL